MAERLQQAGIIIAAIGIGLLIGSVLTVVAGVGCGLIVFGAGAIVFGIVKEAEVTDGTSPPAATRR